MVPKLFGRQQSKVWGVRWKRNEPGLEKHLAHKDSYKEKTQLRLRNTESLGNSVNTNASSKGKKKSGTRQRSHIHRGVIATDEFAIESCD